MPEPRDALTNVLGEMADRAGKYAEIWQDAASRNASKKYDADAALADVQKTFTLALRDMAEMGAAMIEAFSAATTPSASAPSTPPAKKKAPAKKAPAKKKAPK